MIQHFGEQCTHEDYLASVMRTVSQVLRRRVPVRRFKDIFRLRQSWKRAREIAAKPPQMLSSTLPEHELIQQDSLARIDLRQAS